MYVYIYAYMYIYIYTHVYVTQIYTALTELIQAPGCHQNSLKYVCSMYTCIYYVYIHIYNTY